MLVFTLPPFSSSCAVEKASRFRYSQERGSPPVGSISTSVRRLLLDRCVEMYSRKFVQTLRVRRITIATKLINTNLYRLIQITQLKSMVVDSYTSDSFLKNTWSEH